MTTKLIPRYRCVFCGAEGPGSSDGPRWMGGPVSGGGFLVTHWCPDTAVGEPFAQGWHDADPVPECDDFNGHVFDRTTGRYNVSARDFGIEVCRDGQLIFSSRGAGANQDEDTLEDATVLIGS